MTEWPKISIIVPNYNGGDTLGETLQSLVNQDYPRLEIIVIDGGSSDNSIDVINRFEKYITWWVSEKDKGLYDAINKGFSRATGDIFAWIGSGDLYFPHALLTVGDIMRSLPQVQWLTTLNPVLLDYHGNSINVYKVPGYSKRSFLDGRHLHGEPGYTHVIQQESTFWKQDLWAQIGEGINTEYTLGGDFDLWTRFFEIADLYVIDSPLAGFRYRQGQLSTNIAGYIEQGRQCLAKMRQRNNWSRNRLREAADAYRFIIAETFGFKKFARSMLSYQCQQVVRGNPGSAEGIWTIVPRHYM